MLATQNKDGHVSVLQKICFLAILMAG